MGTVFVDPLPSGLDFLEMEEKPPDTDMWDEGTRSFIPRPPKVLVDRWDDLLNDPDFGPSHANLPPPFRAAQERAVKKLLGDERFRNQGEGKEVGR